MNPIFKNVLAVVAGILIGGLVNMAIIMMSSSVVPPPEGIDITTVEGLKEGMPLFKPINFLMPFLAHAIGVLVGAFIAAKIAAKNKMTLALLIGVFFLLGGVANVMMLPSPMWFNLTDLLLAYIPMAWIGGKLAMNKN
ncbi:hypothetical protein [uncultured Planktosalinus sp.]|uniref:hypothetical protein n=1 Tax=uncultured Planktosalinus sp. TaxID=1810935 RepID=UPI0030DC4DDD